MIKDGKVFCDFCGNEMKGFEVKEYSDGIYCSDECRYEDETGKSGEEY